MTAREELTYKSGKPKEFIDTVQVVPLSDALAILDRQKAKLRDVVETWDDEIERLLRESAEKNHDMIRGIINCQADVEAVLKEE